MYYLREADFRYHCVAKRERERKKKKQQQPPPTPPPKSRTNLLVQASYLAGLAQSAACLNTEREVSSTIPGARTMLGM